MDLPSAAEGAPEAPWRLFNPAWFETDQPKEERSEPALEPSPAKRKRNSYNLGTVDAYARSRGGRCLAKASDDFTKSVPFECSNGHHWSSVPQHMVYAHTWCRACAGKEKLTIEAMRELAKAREGACLSTTYERVSSKLRWRCKLGHEWDAKPGNVTHKKSWCPVCAGTSPLTLEIIQAAAKAKGGACLSTSYKNTQSKLLFRCKEGHEWQAKPSIIKTFKHWCPHCASVAAAPIERYKEFALGKGGECLSSARGGEMTFRCKNGHVWQSKGAGMLRLGYWCSQCQIEGIREATTNARNLALHARMAEWFGGKCLSASGFGAERVIRFECGKLHQWEVSGDDPNSKRRLAWCPECAAAGAPLPDAKNRPKWRIVQPRQNAPAALKSKAVIKPTTEASPIGKQALAPVWNAGKVWCEINSAPTYSKAIQANGLGWMRAFAASHGGLCLSDACKSALDDMEFKCGAGHLFKTKVRTVLHRGDWCPRCAYQALVKAKQEQDKAKRVAPTRVELVVQRASTVKHPSPVDPQAQKVAAVASDGPWNPPSPADGSFIPSDLALELASAVEEGRMSSKEAIALLRAQREDSEAKKARSPARISKADGQAPAPLETDKVEAPADDLDPLGWWADVLKGPTAIASKSEPGVIRHYASTGSPDSPAPARWKKPGPTPSEAIIELKRAAKESSLKEVQEYAASKGGKCLAEFLPKLTAITPFQCQYGHRWNANPSAIMRSEAWCPKCSRGSKLAAMDETGGLRSAIVQAALGLAPDEEA